MLSTQRGRQLPGARFRACMYEASVLADTGSAVALPLLFFSFFNPPGTGRIFHFSVSPGGWVFNIFGVVSLLAFLFVSPV